MSLPIDRTSKASLDTNLVNGNTSDAPVIKNSNDVVYNTIDELNGKLDGLVGSTALSPYPPSFLSRQAIINGNFDIWQRGTSLTLGSATSAYLADRFVSQNNTSGATSTVSRVAITDLDGSVYGLQFVHTALPVNQGRLNHFYTIEAADSYKLAGKTVTFSIKVKGVLAMNQISVLARYNTTETAINGSSTFIASVANYTINNATWTTITLTFTCPNRATLTSSGVIGFQITASKTTSEANGDGFIIAQVQVNAGNVALLFQSRSFADELALCQRYYEKSYDITTSPATATGIGAVFSVATTSTIASGFRFKTTKRISAPTVTIYSPSGTSGKVWSSADADVSSGVVVGNPGDSGVRYVNAVGAGLTANTSITYHYTADAEL